MPRLTSVFGLRDRTSPGLRRMTRSFRQFESVTQQSNENLRQIGRARVRPTLRVRDRLTSTLATARRGVERLNGMVSTATIRVNDRVSPVLDNVERRLDGIGGRIAQIGAGAGLSGAGLAYMGSSALSTDALVSATTGMPGKNVTKMIDDIYYKQKIGTSRENVAFSAQRMAQQTDLRGNALKNAVGTTNKFAMMAGKDIASVDRAVASLYNNMGTPPKKAGDLMSYIFKNSGDQADDLLDTFWEYGSTFAKLKIGANNLASALIAGTKGGARNFDELADSMREFGIRQYEMTDDQLAAFDRVMGKSKAQEFLKGINTGNVSGQEGLVTVAKGLSRINDKVAREQVAATLLGTKYEDIGKPILDMANALGKPVKVSGELNKQWEYMRKNNPMTPISDTGKSALKVLKDMGTSIVTGVSPAFDKLNKWMQSKKGQKAIERFSESVTGLAVAFGKTLTGGIQYTLENWDKIAPKLKWTGILIGSMVGYFKILRPAFKGAVKVGRGFRKFLIFTGDAARFVSSKIALLLPYVRSLGRLFLRAAGLIFRLNPATAVISGLVIAGIALWKNWDKIGPKAEELWTKIENAFKTGANGAIGYINKLIEKINLIPGIDIGKLEKYTITPISKGGAPIAHRRLDAFATGTRHAPGGSALVGERGPELVNLPRGSEVLPARKTASMLNKRDRYNGARQGSGKTVSFDQLIGEIHVHDKADEDRLVKKIKRMLERELEEELSLGGLCWHLKQN